MTGDSKTDFEAIRLEGVQDEGPSRDCRILWILTPPKPTQKWDSIEYVSLVLGIVIMEWSSIG